MNSIHGELACFIAVGIGSNRTNFLACLLAHAVGAPLVAASFAEFVEQGRLKVRHVFTYGMGGAVYIISGKPA